MNDDGDMSGREFYRVEITKSIRTEYAVEMRKELFKDEEEAIDFAKVLISDPCVAKKYTTEEHENFSESCNVVIR